MYLDFFSSSRKKKKEKQEEGTIGGKMGHVDQLTDSLD
jgi:hypothetical protein